MGVTKFRAWKKYTQKYLEADELLMNLSNGNLQNLAGGTFRPSDVIVEQYTGIKDVNEKEIYTGDIVKLNAEVLDTFGFEVIKQMVGQVVFSHGCFWIKNIAGAEPLFDYEEYFEVIGNIHENIELLEK